MCEGHGNFLALLLFRISSGDSLLKEHLTTAPKNATYISPDIQNQVIQVLGDHILNKILINVKEAKYFSVIADEVTDSSNKEQLAVVLRYVNPTDNRIREDLVSFLECSGGISGQALAGCLPYLQNTILIPITYVDKPMMVPIIWLGESMALQHVSCFHFPLLSMYTVPPTV